MTAKRRDLIGRFEESLESLRKMDFVELTLEFATIESGLLGLLMVKRFERIIRRLKEDGLPVDAVLEWEQDDLTQLIETNTLRFTELEHLFRNCNMKAARHCVHTLQKG